MADDKKRVGCPVCGNFFAKSAINMHVNKCLNDQEETTDETNASERINNGNEEMSEAKRPKKSGPENPSYETATAAASATCLAAEQAENRETQSQTQSQTSTSSHKPPSLQAAWKHLMSPKRATSSSGKAQTPTGPASMTNENTQDQTMGRSFFSMKGGNLEQSSKDTSSFSESSNTTSSQVLRTEAQSLFRASTRDSKANETKSQKSSSNKPSYKPSAPLAEQMRPFTLQDYVGQDKVVGQNQMIRKLFESQRIPSMILWGPPGCGKTTLAKIIAAQCKENQNARFAQLSATTSGIADVKEAVKMAKNELKMFKRKTILFIDEIHRFNKLQQDTFLPHVEDGTLVLIGATTENPSFQVNNALLSRCRVIVLDKLSTEDLVKILQRALQRLGVTQLEEAFDPEKQPGIYIEANAVETLAHLSDGDARVALNSLQTAVEARAAGSKHALVTVEDIKEGLQRSHVQYDRAGEEHYNCASALQKSIRGSSDNGAIYWLARMLEGGEDPLFIARRLVVCASEDIGLADPQALPLAVATFQACHFIGMPECAINLGHCVTYLARAPKSNESYSALQKARHSIQNHEGPLPGVPIHLRNAPTKLMKNLGYGKGYKYNHAYSEPVEQEYLPQELLGTNFFSKD